MDGLELAWTLGFKDILVQIDCMVALRLVQHGGEDQNSNRSIVQRIQRLMAQEWRVTVSHTYREGNLCADMLATYALDLEPGYHRLQEPPEDLLHFLRDDVGGVGSVRLC
ncbi:hypothetical protein QN277_019040 [Acacia crassicarpa]|uniref:RNase H type-1 domain-containing protein n=1 Tax=Acacia crassicarpa TaxID=499986 RepID=A0AAE1JUV8_9FABA|nr:hypothetical protein QN277_019040 [Acacia crassicarpa]